MECSFQALAIDTSPNRTVDGRILHTMIGHGGSVCNILIGLCFTTCGVSSGLKRTSPVHVLSSTSVEAFFLPRGPFPLSLRELLLTRLGFHAQFFLSHCARGIFFCPAGAERSLGLGLEASPPTRLRVRPSRHSPACGPSLFPSLAEDPRSGPASPPAGLAARDPHALASSLLWPAGATKARKPGTRGKREKKPPRKWTKKEGLTR